MYEVKIKRIAEHYGLEKQLVQTAEESSELTQAALKYKRVLEHPVIPDGADQLKDNLIEEMADTLIMIEQICYLLNCENDLRAVVYRKTDRQIERMRKTE